MKRVVLIIISFMFTFLQGSASAVRQDITKDTELFPTRPKADPIRLNVLPLSSSDGTVFNLKVNSLDTVKAVKDQIQSVRHHPADRQRLYLYSQRQELKDNRQINIYNIKNGSSLILVIERTQIYVKSTTGFTIGLYLGKWDTINDVKDKIQEERGIAANQQHLIFDEDVLEDANSTSDYNIVHGSTILLVPLVSCSPNRRLSSSERNFSNLIQTPPVKEMPLSSEIEILIRTSDEKTISVRVDVPAIIEDIKYKLESKVGILKSLQVLIFAEQELKNSRSLYDYGIGSGSTLLLIVRQSCIIAITVNLPDNTVVVLNMEPWDTTRDVKKLIQEKKLFATHLQLLRFNEIELEDNHTLSFYKVQAGTILNLTLRVNNPFSIDIHFDDGIINSMNIENWDTIWHVKRRLQDPASASLLRLIFDEQELEDSHKVSEYNIQAGSKLIVKLRSGRKLYIRYLPLRTLVVDVELDNTVAEVKIKIQDRLGTPTASQRLFFAGQELESSHNLSHYNIDFDSTIRLVSPRLSKLQLT